MEQNTEDLHEEIDVRWAHLRKNIYCSTPAMVAESLDKYLQVCHKISKDVTRENVCTDLLETAVINNRDDILQYLIEQGADINAHRNRDVDKGSFLHQAIFYGADDTAKILINSGADLDARDNEKCTPLHYAILFNAIGEISANIILLLLKKKSDLNALDKSESKPHELIDIPEIQDLFNAYEWMKKRPALKELIEKTSDATVFIQTYRAEKEREEKATFDKMIDDSSRLKIKLFARPQQPKKTP